MTDLPPIEYLDEAAKVFAYSNWMDASRNPVLALTCQGRIIAHARALHQLAQARAEIAALKPRETLEDVARREAMCRMTARGQAAFVLGFLRGVQMQKEGVLPDA